GPDDAFAETVGEAVVDERFGHVIQADEIQRGGAVVPQVDRAEIPADTLHDLFERLVEDKLKVKGAVSCGGDGVQHAELRRATLKVGNALAARRQQGGQTGFELCDLVGGRAGVRRGDIA